MYRRIFLQSFARFGKRGRTRCQHVRKTIRLIIGRPLWGDHAGEDMSSGLGMFCVVRKDTVVHAVFPESEGGIDV